MWVGLGLAAPILVHLSSSSLPFRDAVVAAPSNSYTLVRPLELAGATVVRVEHGTILLTDGSGKLVSSSAAAALLSSGAGALMLENAAISVAGARSALPEVSLPVAPLADALAALRTEALMLRKSTVAVTLPGGQVETLYGVEAVASLKRKGLAVIRGTGTLRGQRVTFDVTSGLQLERRAGAPGTVSMRAQVRSPLLDVQFDGRAAMADGLQLDGQGELSLSSVRQVARWFGAYWPAGPGLKSVAVRGQLTWNSRSLMFDRSSVRIDGNTATGVLELALAQARPALDGTLAFKALDLSPFLRNSNDPAERGSNALSMLIASAFSVPLGGLLDADMRVSAERVMLDGTDFGGSALTISLKDGRMLADIAELQIGQGRGAVQVRADLTAFNPRLSLRGKLDNVDLARFLTVAQKPLLQAPGSIVLDLTAHGSTTADLLRSMSGRINVKTLDAGRIGLDLRRALAAASDGDLHGWATVSRGTTMFEAADLRLVARDGVVLTESAEVRTGDGLWTATGLVNLHAERIDLRVSQILAPQRLIPADLGQLSGRPSVLEIRGPWAQPTIRAIADPGSASAPDAGSGATQRKSAAPKRG
jgi:AsmA protein